MSSVIWAIASTVIAVVTWHYVRKLGRADRTRDQVLDEVCRSLAEGHLEHVRGSGPQARGRLGQLEVTVDLHSDPKRAAQSPMWRIMAVGPVALDVPVEAHVAGWKGWIDPWMETGKGIRIPASNGPSFSMHAEKPVNPDHRVVIALQSQGSALGPGGLHVRRDFMRGEVRFDSRLERNRALFGYLQAMAEISERNPTRSLRDRNRPRVEIRGGR